MKPGNDLAEYHESQKKRSFRRVELNTYYMSDYMLDRSENATPTSQFPLLHNCLGRHALWR